MKKSAHNRIRLTTNDKKVFSVLKMLRCLERPQIETLLNKKPGTFRKRLWLLQQQDYLEKIQYGANGGLYRTAWTAGAKLKSECRPFLKTRLSELEHQLDLNQLFIDLASKGNFYEKLGWLDGNLNPIQFGSEKIYPDAIISSIDQSVKIFLEYDRATKSKERLADQIKRYRDYFMSPYTNKNEILIFAVPEKNQGRLDTIKSIYAELFPLLSQATQIYAGDTSTVLKIMARILNACVAPKDLHVLKISDL